MDEILDITGLHVNPFIINEEALLLQFILIFVKQGHGVLFSETDSGNVTLVRGYKFGLFRSNFVDFEIFKTLANCGAQLYGGWRIVQKYEYETLYLYTSHIDPSTGR